MRHITFLFFLVFAFQSFGQSFSGKQKTLITKRTATWCPLCGTWGWDMDEGLRALNKEDAIIIKAHYSGDLATQVASDITNNWNASYQPEFYINEVIQNVGSTTWSNKIQDFATAIDANSKKDANVSFEMSTSSSGNEITADAKITFLDTVEGDYYLGIYLVEDNIINYQASQGDNAIHHGVLQASFNGESFGSLIASNTTLEGVEVLESLTLDVEGESLSNRTLNVLAIVWRKDGNLYRVENLHQVALGTAASVNDQVKVEEFRVIQKGQELEVSFALSDDYKSGEINLYHVNGQKMNSKDFNPHKGYNHLSLPIDDLRGNFVFLTIIGDHQILTSKKVFIK